MGKGYLAIQTVTAGGAVNVANASITIADKNNQVLYELRTNNIGFAPVVELEAPDKWHLEDPYAPGPRYSLYNVLVRAPGYTTVSYEGVMIFDTTTTVLKVVMDPVVLGQENAVQRIYVGGHNLDWTAEPDEDPVSPVQEADPVSPVQLQDPIQVITPRLLREVAIPNFITVHLGRHTATAPNVRVPFIDYIKNVTSHEIFDEWATVAEQAVIANIYCIVSFTLNRVFTEFYRTQGYGFDITSETYMDQKFVYGGIIGARISVIVDRIFNYYLAVIGHREPFLALYNDGIRVNIPGRLSQWGSFYDARDLRMTAWQIIKKYFPQNLELRECDNFGGVTESYPGYTLTVGTRGDAVRVMQLYLNRILGRYTNVIINPVDGIYGEQTRNSVLMFQQLYNLPQTGSIDRRTWYEISRLFAVEKGLWEMYSEGLRIGIGTTPPTRTTRQGDTGALVTELQFLLDFIAMYHAEIPFVPQTSRFESLTAEGVRAFQRLFGLIADGVVGATTWRTLYDVYWGIMENTTPQPPIPPIIVPPVNIPPFPGVPLTVGSTGSNVRLVQAAINRLADVIPGLWRITEDGIFGNGTRDAVMAFQRIYGLTVDGIVGPVTWRRLMEESNASWPGIGPSIPPFPGTLTVGSRGPNVLLVQQAINRLAPYYPGRLWIIAEDSVYGTMTRDAIYSFQSIFGLPVTGIVNQATWDKLMQESLPPSIPAFPGNLSVGSTGQNVRLVQQAINRLAPYHPGRLWILSEDGIYGNMVRDAIYTFQSIFGLPITGVVNQVTWDRLMREAASVGGSSGLVQVMQSGGAVGNYDAGNEQLTQYLTLLAVSMLL